MKNILLVLTVLWMMSCGSDPTTNQPNITNGESPITCTIDGEPWMAEAITGTYIETGGQMIINVGGTTMAEGRFAMLGIKIFNFSGEGTYHTNDNGVKTMISLTGKGGSYTNMGVPSTVEVTSYDAATKTISGTFKVDLKVNPMNFTGEEYPEQAIITDGVFKDIELKEMQVQ